MGLSLSLRCFEGWALCIPPHLASPRSCQLHCVRSPVALVPSPAVGYALLPAVGCALLPFLGFWGIFPGCFFCLSPSMPALSCARYWRRYPAGTTHVVVRPCFQGLPGRRLARRPCDRAPWPCTAVEVSWFMTPFSSRLMFVARLQLRTHNFCSRHCISDLVPRGQRALLDQFRTV